MFSSLDATLDQKQKLADIHAEEGNKLKRLLQTAESQPLSEPDKQYAEIVLPSNQKAVLMGMHLLRTRVEGVLEFFSADDKLIRPSFTDLLKKINAKISTMEKEKTVIKSLEIIQECIEDYDKIILEYKKIRQECSFRR